MIRCAAITDRAEHRCQQTWRKDCENTAVQIIDGIPLCGTHLNALARGDLPVRAVLKTPPEFAQEDAA